MASGRYERAFWTAPSGALGATRPDPPPHPHNPPSGLIRAVAPSGATPLPLPPTPSLSPSSPLSTRAGDRSGLAQVLRALQHPPSIHSPPNSAYGSFYLPPSGSSPYWKRLPVRPWGIRCDRQRLPGYTARHEPPYPRASALMSSNRRFPAPVREAMTASGAAATCIPVELDGGAPEAAFFINLAGAGEQGGPQGHPEMARSPVARARRATSSRPRTGRWWCCVRRCIPDRSIPSYARSW